MKEINSNTNNWSAGSVIGTIAAVIVILFLVGILLRLVGWALGALIPLLVVAALVLVIYRLYQGKKIL